MSDHIDRRSALKQAAALCVAVSQSEVTASNRSPRLTEVFHSDSFQFTGIAVSQQGRLFINFPRWSPEYLNAVIEVAPDGSIKPFPDEEWNCWDFAPPTALSEQLTELVSDKPL